MAILLLVPFLVLSGCSSAPDGPVQVTEKKDRAAEYAELGNEHFNAGNYATALTFFQQALGYNVSVDNERGMADSHNSLGKVYMALGRYDDAEDSFQAALELGTLLEDRPLLARCSSNLGELYILREEYEQARGALDRALQYMDEERPTADLAILYHNMGMVAKKTQDPRSAFEYFNKALAINTERSAYEEMASNHYMIASLHSKAGEYDLATRHAQLALSYDKRVENSLGIAGDLLALGIISLRSADREGAYALFKKSYLVYTSVENRTGMLQLLTWLINTAELLGYSDEVETYTRQRDALSAESSAGR
jgi:tetratricopeptide (TPR) repeat protein